MKAVYALNRTSQPIWWKENAALSVVSYTDKCMYVCMYVCMYPYSSGFAIDILHTLFFTTAMLSARHVLFF